MTLYISNYATSGNSPLAVSISHPSDVPETFTGTRDELLAPSTELLTEYHDGTLTNAEYAERYIALLGERGLTPSSISERFDDGTIFVCYDYEDGEASDGDADNGDTKTCHRIFLAKWLNDNGVETVALDVEAVNEEEVAI
jgi:uncharacterized protein YeaO (DUF488 family)